MERYNFDPKKMLGDVCMTMTHFAEAQEFWREVVSNGYYNSGESLIKAINTVGKHNMISAEAQTKLQVLLAGAKSFETSNVTLTELAGKSRAIFHFSFRSYFSLLFLSLCTAHMI